MQKATSLIINIVVMQKGNKMFKVPYGQDPYTAIGQYIRDHLTAIEDMIATIEINGVRTNELFLVDMNEKGCFVWQSDWYEGEEDIALIDFFPVSDAEPERKKGKWLYNSFLDAWRCDQCFQSSFEKGNFCPHCGADMRG